MPVRFPVLLVLFFITAPAAAGDSIRGTAVVDVSFDGPTLVDEAGGGGRRDVVTMQGTPQSIASPFWNQSGRAVVLDATQQHRIAVADSDETDRPDAVTVSLFFLNLHPLTDAGYHGIFGKRTDAAPFTTNYGLNYQMRGDVFQLYINDTTGFKVASYSARRTIDFSRLVHLTATFEVGDAPAEDADRDRDDVLVRLFINGRPVKPKASNAGFVSDYDAWLNNIDVSKLLNDVRLNIGSSFGASETASGVYDEFLLFDRALTMDEVRQLFTELTGKTPEEVTKWEREQARPQPRKRPTLKSLAPRGLQIGGTTRVTMTGDQLAGAEFYSAELPAKTAIIESSATRLVADITIPDSVVPGFYPVKVTGPAGISNALVMSVDRLREVSAAGLTAKNVDLPVAVSGVISGTQEAVVTFNGSKGQRIVADVESRRLGAQLDSVLEVRTHTARPLTVAWRKQQLGGDTRAVVVLPEDGLYAVVLHDLAYKAPGGSAYRIRLGDLRVVDRLVRVSTDEGPELLGFGEGVDNGARVSLGTAGSDLDGPLPPIPDERSRGVLEAPQVKRESLDATFAADPHRAVLVHGHIAAAGEVDEYQLSVVEKSRLHFRFRDRSLGSRLVGAIEVLADSKRLIARDAVAGTDLAFDLTVPAGVRLLKVRIRDFTGGGGPDCAYRLTVAKSGRVDFRLEADSDSVEIPADGTGLLRLKVIRNAPGFAYHGPIRLRVEGTAGVSVMPRELPAEKQNRDVFVILTRSGAKPTVVSSIRLVAESVGDVVKSRLIEVPSAGSSIVTDATQLVTLVPGRSGAARVKLGQTPQTVFRGMEQLIPTSIQRAADSTATVRFRLTTTEKPRAVDPRNAALGVRPLIRAVPYQFLSPGQSEVALRVVVPLDQVDGEVDGVVVAELVNQPFAPVNLGEVYSAPFRLRVQSAVRVAPKAASLSLSLSGARQVTGTLSRTTGFDDAVTLSLVGLPAGYVPSGVTLPPKATEFALAITLPKGVKPATLKNTRLLAKTSRDEVIADVPVALKVVP